MNRLLARIEPEHLARALREQIRSLARHRTLQGFRWVNGIEYSYGPNDRLRLRLHVVVCEERWTTRDREGKETEHHARFAWVARTPLNAKNVVERCDRAARHRWDIAEH